MSDGSNLNNKNTEKNNKADGEKNHLITSQLMELDINDDSNSDNLPRCCTLDSSMKRKSKFREFHESCALEETLRPTKDHLDITLRGYMILPSFLRKIMDLKGKEQGTSSLNENEIIVQEVTTISDDGIDVSNPTGIKATSTSQNNIILSIT